MAHTSPHRRFNPLNGKWVLVSPQRNQRPWQGEEAKRQLPQSVKHDPTCYLCPGTTRANGFKNPDYSGTYVFPNDFPAMRPTDESGLGTDDPLFQLESVRGEARVLCFSERHDLTLSRLSLKGLEAVVRTWKSQFIELSKDYNWVALFENKGAMMGCSNPHPHGQIWASDHIPDEVLVEDKNQQAYFAKNGSPLLLDYAHLEAEKESRVVAINGDWIVVVPWWATWPFETLLLPLHPIRDLSELTSEQEKSLADIIRQLTIKYDNLFETDFPYSMGWHGALPGKGDQPHWQLHAHFYPPLLRSATIRKFMVGYEMLAEPQRDMTAETAAERLKSLSDKHFSQSDY